MVSTPKLSGSRSENTEKNFEQLRNFAILILTWLYKNRETIMNMHNNLKTWIYGFVYQINESFYGTMMPSFTSRWNVRGLKVKVVDWQEYYVKKRKCVEEP